MAGFRHVAWTAQGTTPAEIEAALRKLLVEGQMRYAGHAPARALNMVCVADRRSSDEVAERLRGAGRYLASRTIVCAVEPGRATIDATAIISAGESDDRDPTPLRETVILELGDQHVPRLEAIVDPLVVTDLPTVVWSPHGHRDAVTALLPLAQVVLLDSVEEHDLEEGLHHACEVLKSAYVVDLAWLRSTPWRERVAATFDPADLRPELHMISTVAVRHDPESAVAGLLLVGWLGSRLNWALTPLRARNGALAGIGRAQAGEVKIALEPVTQNVRGLSGLTLETSSGRRLTLDRGPGGLRAHYRNARGDERTWTVLGASRGEGGILGEGIRQALLRDPTYGPAATAAMNLVGP